jgi:hypothetical protein
MEEYFKLNDKNNIKNGNVNNETATTSDQESSKSSTNLSATMLSRLNFNPKAENTPIPSTPSQKITNEIKNDTIIESKNKDKNEIVISIDRDSAQKKVLVSKVVEVHPSSISSQSSLNSQTQIKPIYCSIDIPKRTSSSTEKDSVFKRLKLDKSESNNNNNNSEIRTISKNGDYQSRSKSPPPPPPLDSSKVIKTKITFNDQQNHQNRSKYSQSKGQTNHNKNNYKKTKPTFYNEKVMNNNRNENVYDRIKFNKK